MGTNFYAVRIPSEADLIKMHALIDAGQLTTSHRVTDEETTLEEFLSEFSKEIHLCKRSGGWKICWDHNWGEYYDPTLQSMREFLEREHLAIKDEYGEYYDPDEFFKEMLEWDKSKWNGVHEPFDSLTYNKAHPDDRSWPDTEGQNKCKARWGIVFESIYQSDFYSKDGIRFATFSDFS